MADAPSDEAPKKKRRKSRFDVGPPADAAPPAGPAAAGGGGAAGAADQFLGSLGAAPGGGNPVAAAQQALQGSAYGPAAGPTPGGGANAIPLGAGGGPGGSPGSAPSGGLQFADEPPRTTIPPGPERLVGSKELRGLDAEAAIAMAAPKAAPEEQVVQQNMEPGVVSELIKIPNEAVGLVIGRAGETIRQLQIRAGADIQVSRDQGDERGIIIMGPAENVNVAKGLIERIVEEKMSSIPGGGAGSGANAMGAHRGGLGLGGGGGGGDEVRFMIPSRHVVRLRPA